MKDSSGGACGGNVGSGGDSGGSGQQLGVMAVAGSSPHLAKMADGCVNRSMTNMRKFGFLEYVCETKNKINKILDVTYRT